MEAMALLSYVVPHHVRSHLGHAELELSFELSRRYWIPAHVRPPRAATVQGSEMRMSPIGCRRLKLHPPWGRAHAAGDDTRGCLATIQRRPGRRGIYFGWAAARCGSP